MDELPVPDQPLDVPAASEAPPGDRPRRDHPRGRGRFLGPVLATSVVSSLVASLATVAILTGTVMPARSAATPTASPAGTGPAVQPASSTTSEDPVVAVAAKVSAAVVTISSTTGSGIGLFGAPTNAIGSGFIYDANGLILTNAHVVENATQLTVRLEDGRELDGRIVASDTTRDLAVVKVDATGLPAVEIGTSADLKVGQLVVAIGSPLGAFTDSVTSGILSALGRTITVRDAFTGRPKALDGLLQTDAAINEGNSGGPLLDASGRVVGINAASASNAEGLGFAIPIDSAAGLIASARS
jgi:serine protease Do